MNTEILKKITATFIIALALTTCGCARNGARGSLKNIDYILVEKKKHTISVFNDNKKLATYYVSLGKSPLGHKEREGDNRTPEGTYRVINKNPKDQYFKSLTLSYPNKKDIENAAKKGVHPGFGIQVHGYSKNVAWVNQDNHPRDDITRGCILLTNPEMEQIFQATKIGTKVEIRP